MAAPGGRARWGATLRSTWFKVTAAVAAAAALGAGAFLAGGYDTAQTKVDDASVWALQTGQGERYARVDTALGQLDTVKSVTSPNDIVQADGQVVVYAQGNASGAQVDLAQPASFTAASLKPTPAGTKQVFSTGDYVGYLSSTGEVRAGRIEQGVQSGGPAIAAPGSGGKRAFAADTIAIGTDGVLYAYSHIAHQVLRFDIPTGRTLGTDSLANGPDDASASMTVVGSTWVLLDGDGAHMWVRGVAGRLTTRLGDKAVLQKPSGAESVVVAASGTELVAYDLATGRRYPALASGQNGEPAAPTWAGTRLYAAWLTQDAGPGHLWIGAARMGRQPSTYRVRNLGYGSIAGKPGQLSNDITPEFRTNGSAMILNDSSSGWVWSVPSGQLVQGSQNWDLGQTTSTRTDTRQIDQTRESDPTPPVAVDDQFGVRAGSLVTLPVMLNDYDANGDVISIVPGSVTGLDPRFGTASVADSGQTITVQVQPNAPPTATFTYEVTDGTTKNGLDSAPATVTLTVHPASQNGAPVWCNGYSAEECLVTWPDNTEVAQGGSVEIPILRGWVDPDGDPMFATATGLSDPADTVSVTPDGNLVFQAAAGSRTGDVDVAVTVSDVLGATTTKTLHLKVVARSTITVENFGLMTAVGVPLTVDPSTHIRSAQGTPQIVNASLPSSTTANIAIDSSGATFQFEAADVGSYPVTMTVKDPATGATATATVRITVVSDAQPTISTAPVTVFVRPDTDTSVDVFSAVQNPTGRVLLLSDPQPDPAPGASLDVDVVGQAQLRVRGTTGSGAPGLLGTVHYVVSDGTDSPGMRVNGVASVYLLPNALPGRPVAIDDSVTVRAGAQVDVPVLANDVGQGGDFVELDPSRIVNESHQGLAFASGQLLRLLAPDHATTYTIRYSAYSAGNPSAESTASVHVTVLPQGSDRPPRPVTLTGRVAAGEKVRIPFNPFGIDPDGDMVSLDRISQPKQGTAQITPDGTAIIYTAAPGGEGQQSFSYEVRDSEGETGQGTVMVGVLKNAQTDPAPVTYSDYVQVKAGAGNRVVVQPTDNDIDPNGGALTLGAVTPDVPSGSAQYAALAGAIISKSGGEVVIRATPRPRTLTYVYSVTNAQGDVSEGLIVVDVVSGDVPDWPVAVDTVVDAQSRSRLAEGIDVLAGKVSWGAGEVGALTLSVPGAPSGVSVVGGDAIRVAHVPASGMIVPFKLTGKDFTGHEAWTYGFLRIPALADVILTLKSGFPPLTVKEGGSGQVQLANWINAPSDSPLNFATDAKTTGTRPGSSCEITADGTLTYNAGLRAPWTDACTIEVQTLTQKDFTKIAIPIEITPLQPEPQLRPASLTESPGQPALHYDLAQMVTWLDHENEIPSMDYAVAYSGTQFTVVRQGSEVVVTAKDDARPGTVEQATVTLPGHPGVTATITLKVGPVASQRPAGGSTTLSCSEANGTSCTTTVVGLSDEINAFPGTPLQVVGVASQVPGCTGVTFAVSSTRTVTAKWSADAPGGTCTVPFTVQDAQGRRSTSTGSGSGALSFELKGYPAAPASVTQVGYTGTSVTLAIAPGDAATAYPAITGFVVTMDGQSAVTCTAAGVCPAVTGLQNGAKHVFEARAVNEVGLSK
ncbi:MAG: Ig-like domain-containing protein, partial [Microbacteriaceae bacterium]|nr:Ig-like domain-containing protein [Microbacteriaceae bacterium]